MAFHSIKKVIVIIIVIAAAVLLYGIYGFIEAAQPRSSSDLIETSDILLRSQLYTVVSLFFIVFSAITLKIINIIELELSRLQLENKNTLKSL